MVTRQDLENLDIAAVRTVADSWHDLSGTARTAGENVDGSAVRKVSGTQQGATADALTGRLTKLRDNCRYVSEESGTVHAALSSLADALESAQQQLKDAYHRLEGMPGFRLERDGSVSYPMDPPPGGWPNARGGAGGPVPPGGPEGEVRGRVSAASDDPLPAAAAHGVPAPDGQRVTTGPAPAHDVPAWLPAHHGGTADHDQDARLDSVDDEPYQDTAPGQVFQTDGPNRRAAQGVFDLIDGAVKRAGHTDEEFTSVLRKLTARHGDDVGPAVWSDVAAGERAFARAANSGRLSLDSIPAPRSDPEEVAQWWRDLPDAERDDLLAGAPDRLGRLDGLPAGVRDQANRTCLPALIAKYEGDAGGQDGADKLSGLMAIHKRLANEAGGHVPVMLMDLGDEGHGRATISFGDPGTADHVTALVPGNGTRLDSVAGDGFEQARNVWIAAGKADPTQSVASIVTLPYDAPQADPLDVARDPSVLGTAGADQGSVHYNRLLNGIHAAHSTGSPHVTAIGHDYGSAVVGRAATRSGGLRADEMVLVGSPGMAVGHACELGMGADHVYVGAADGDPVTQHTGRTADTADPEQAWFAHDPAGAGFGAQRFAVASEGPAPSDGGGYLDPMAPKSLSNIGRIVTGHGAHITRQAHR